MNFTEPPPLAYSVSEACRMSSLGKTRLYQLISEGHLEARKIGRRTVIRKRKSTPTWFRQAA